MSTQRNNNGGHAFPTLFIDPEHGSGYPGMSLRDWFAGQALQGMTSTVRWTTPNEFSETAYAIADAMIEARKKDYIIDRGEGR
jgi:hypothetical protein